MKKLLRSTFGTLLVAAFLAIVPPTYARGGHGGGHAARGHGHAIAHATRGHAGFVRGGRGQRFVGHGRRNAWFAGRGFRAARGGWGRGWRGSSWGGSNWYPYSGYYGWGWGYPYYGSYGYYYPYYGYYPYRYGYWPYWGLNFGFTFY